MSMSFSADPRFQEGDGDLRDSHHSTLEYSAQDWRKNEEVMKDSCAKDRVAFLLMRAPTMSKPSPRLIQLEAESPTVFPITTTSAHHTAENHRVNTPRELKHERRKDR